MRVVSGELSGLTGVVVGITNDDRVEVKADLKELSDVLVLDPVELTKSFQVGMRHWLWVLVLVVVCSCILFMSCLCATLACFVVLSEGLKGCNYPIHKQHIHSQGTHPFTSTPSPQKGDHVKVASGPALGQTGLVVKVEEHICWVFTDTGKEEVQVFARDLVEAAAAETTGVQSYVAVQVKGVPVKGVPRKGVPCTPAFFTHTSAAAAIQQAAALLAPAVGFVIANFSIAAQHTTHTVNVPLEPPTTAGLVSTICTTWCSLTTQLGWWLVWRRMPATFLATWGSLGDQTCALARLGTFGGGLTWDRSDGVCCSLCKFVSVWRCVSMCLSC